MRIFLMLIVAFYDFEIVQMGSNMVLCQILYLFVDFHDIRMDVFSKISHVFNKDLCLDYCFKSDVGEQILGLVIYFVFDHDFFGLILILENYGVVLCVDLMYWKFQHIFDFQLKIFYLFLENLFFSKGIYLVFFGNKVSFINQKL